MKERGGWGRERQTDREREKERDYKYTHDKQEIGERGRRDKKKDWILTVKR